MWSSALKRKEAWRWSGRLLLRRLAVTSINRSDSKPKHLDLPNNHSALDHSQCKRIHLQVWSDRPVIPATLQNRAAMAHQPRLANHISRTALFVILGWHQESQSTEASNQECLLDAIELEDCEDAAVAIFDSGFDSRHYFCRCHAAI